MTATTATARGQHPALPAPEACAFPEALTRTPHWVGWKWGTRNGKRTKLPMDPHTGKNASSADPATWADFPTARACALRHGYGLGFMLAPPFVGIDLDHCRDAATGALSTLGVSVLGELDTYAEVSVSGTGVKAIAYGEKPGTRCRRNGLELEIYSGKRLFALTGQRLAAAPLQINDCQDAVSHIYVATFGATAPAPTPPAPAFVTTDDDRAVLDWLATYNRKFPALWAGDTNAYNHDASAADQALCNMLAFRTGDENRVDSLFRLSGLYRPKWERSDYRHATISKAMQQRRFFTPPSTPTPSTVDAPPKTDDSPPWTDASPAPDLAALQRENARLRAALDAERATAAALRARLDATHALLTNGGITPVERVAAYGLMIEGTAAASRGETSAADPEARPVNCTAIAENVGLSRQTVSATITRFAERGQLRKATTAKLARTGTPYTEIAVCLPGDSLTDNLRTAATWHRPEGTKGVGGNGRRCPKCNGTTTKKAIETKTVETTTLSCADCGHVHTQTRRTIGTPTTAYSLQEAADVPTMLDLAAMRGDTPSTVDAPPPIRRDTSAGPRHGVGVRPHQHDCGKTPCKLPTPPVPSAPPSTLAAPRDGNGHVAGWAGTHLCGDCGATCYALAGTTPRCLPCQRGRDAGGDVASDAAGQPAPAQRVTEHGAWYEGPATIVTHCAVFGRMTTPARKWRVGEVRPYAQYPVSAIVAYVKPSNRKAVYLSVVPEDIRYITIEQDGATVYDSRADVPCDMERWAQTRARFAKGPALHVGEVAATGDD
jgi:ssDNA-binding Zn-finger/Zn-ribbon topoisomerase 1